MLFLSKTSMFRKSRLSASGGVSTTFLLTLGWLGPLLSTIFGPPGRSLERSGHSRGVAGAPQEALQQHVGALACSKSGRKRAESNFGLRWDVLPPPWGPSWWDFTSKSTLFGQSLCVPCQSAAVRAQHIEYSYDNHSGPQTP